MIRAHGTKRPLAIALLLHAIAALALAFAPVAPVRTASPVRAVDAVRGAFVSALRGSTEPVVERPRAIDRDRGVRRRAGTPLLELTLAATRPRAVDAAQARLLARTSGRGRSGAFSPPEARAPGARGPPASA